MGYTYDVVEMLAAAQDSNLELYRKGIQNGVAAAGKNSNHAVLSGESPLQATAADGKKVLLSRPAYEHTDTLIRELSKELDAMRGEYAMLESRLLFAPDEGGQLSRAETEYENATSRMLGLLSDLSNLLAYRTITTKTIPENTLADSRASADALLAERSALLARASSHTGVSHSERGQQPKDIHSRADALFKDAEMALRRANDYWPNRLDHVVVKRPTKTPANTSASASGKKQNKQQQKGGGAVRRKGLSANAAMQFLGLMRNMGINHAK